MSLELSPYSGTIVNYLPKVVTFNEEPVPQAEAESELSRSSALNALDNRVKVLDQKMSNADGGIVATALVILSLGAIAVGASALPVTAVAVGVAVVVGMIALPVLLSEKSEAQNQSQEIGELLKKLRKSSQEKLGFSELFAIVSKMNKDREVLAELASQMNFRQIMCLNSEQIKSLAHTKPTSVLHRIEAINHADPKTIRESHYLTSLIRSDAVFRDALVKKLITHHQLNNELVAFFNANGACIVESKEYRNNRYYETQYQNLDSKLNVSTKHFADGYYYTDIFLRDRHFPNYRHSVWVNSPMRLPDTNLSVLSDLLHGTSKVITNFNVKALVETIAVAGYIPEGQQLARENIRPLEQETKDLLWARLDEEVTENATLFDEETLYELVEKHPEFIKLSQYCEKMALDAYPVIDDTNWDRVAKIAQQLSSESLRVRCRQAVIADMINPSFDFMQSVKRAIQVMDPTLFLNEYENFRPQWQVRGFKEIVDLYVRSEDPHVKERCMNIIRNLPVKSLQLKPDELPAAIVDHFISVGAI